MKHFVLFAFAAGVLSAVVGCGGNKAPYGVVPVAGVVTYKGAPLPQNFKIDFLPEDGKRGSGAILRGNDGAFTAVHTVSQDGVPTGKCKVTVAWAGPIGTSPPEEFAPLLQKYGFGKEGLPMEITKKDLKMKIDFPE